MKIAITTCNRNPSYIGTTLDGLFRSDDMTNANVRVFIHEPNAECLGDWKYDKRITYRTLSADEVKEKNRLGRRPKVAHATRIALDEAGGEVLLLQDDALFVPGWWTKFQALLKTAEPLNHWMMIALCSHLPSNGSGLVPWDPRSYYGLVAMYFGSVAAQHAANALVTGKADETNPGIGADVRLQKMLMRRQIKLYSMRPTVVHHLGEVSSIGSRSESARRATARNVKT